MRTGRLFSFVFRKLRDVLLFSFVCAALMLTVLFLLAPIQYESGTTLFISNKNFTSGEEVTYADMLAGKSLVENYAEIIKSGMFAEGIIKTLELKNISPESLSSRIETKLLRNANALDIKVRYGDKDTARKIAGILPAVIDERSPLFTAPKFITVLNSPDEAKPLIAAKLLIVLATFGFTFCVSVVFLMIFHQGNNIIKSPEDVENYLGLTVTGTIPDFKL